MFLSIFELDKGRFVIRNGLTGILISRNGVVRTFKSQKKAQKYITKSMLSMNRAIQGLAKTHGLPKI